MAVQRTQKGNKGLPDPWPVALRLLSRRDYSRVELERRLTERGYLPEEIARVLERCADFDYLDDERFALNRARSLMRQGRAFGPRILTDLHQRGVAKGVAQQALEKAREEYSEDQLLHEILERRFHDFDYSAAPARERRRVIHFLQRRGLTIDRIMRHLTGKGELD